ncbi:probable ATP-dependent RNA helicase DHX37 isoform X1 [Rhopilema esculentum]|uniref:probable ATP-dependent RNA helicase DHX37 isoform X1 n=1 Tax=Rhopilema esculentum TaxID=499914 RepID=UPI0031D36067
MRRRLIQFICPARVNILEGLNQQRSPSVYDFNEMGKVKRYNYAARNKHISSTNEISKNLSKQAITADNIVEGTDGDEYCSVAEPNALIVPKEKIPKRKNTDKAKDVKHLSKRKMKQIEKVLEKRKKRARRSEVLNSLSQYQVSDKELAMYQSVSRIGQTNLIDKQVNLNTQQAMPSEQDIKNALVSGKKRGKRLRKIKKLNEAVHSKKEKVDIVVDDNLDDSSDESSDDESEESGKEEDNLDEEGSKVIQNELEKAQEFTNLPEEGKGLTKVPEEDKNAQEATMELEGKGAKKVESSNKNDPTKTTEATQIQERPVSEPAVYVELDRTPEVQASRVLLPILGEEQSIMETIKDNNIVLICGETGSGKTTQVPQFLYEAGFSTHKPNEGMIGITEPRRVAAISMSKRVAKEMNLNSSIVSYQIRYEGNVRDTTRIKFMTDGVLLKEMESDFLLTKYSVVIIDEAHERSVFTDILIGLLSRVVPLRNKKGNPMKLIIMSATLRIEDFVDNKRLFPLPPPVLKIDSRQYPVTIHFNKKTPDDYVTEAYKKVCKIHRTLKSGGILVFVTGQNEVHSMCRKLKRTFVAGFSKKSHTFQGKDRKRNKKADKASKSEGFSLDNYPVVTTDSLYEDYDGEQDGASDDSELEEDDAYDEEIDSNLPLHVLPLFSLLSNEKQAKVFEPCPEGSRLCVISTNVAETSLTIPGIKYVVDCGKVKTRLYDKLTGVSSFRITWASKASANQRAGRAGRVEPGHCYRLYSSAVFQHEFDDYSQAEICRRPADELLLLMKNMGIEKVHNFPFPTAPESETWKAAEKHLLDLGALEEKKVKRGDYNTTVTALGKTMAQLPIAPRYAKMILLAHQENSLQYIIIIVAALTVKEIFTDDVKIDENLIANDEDAVKKKRSLLTQARRKWAGTGEKSLLGDMMVLLRAVGACEFAGCSEKFCQENGLRYKAMAEIRKLRAHLSKAVTAINPNVDVFVDPRMKPPSEIQSKVIRQILLSCLGDRVAKKIPSSEIKDISQKNAYQSCSTADPVFIHPASAMFDKLPDYLVYQEIIETSKLYMKGVTAIEENWLPVFAPYLCTFSKPLESLKPSYDIKSGRMKCHMTSTYGPHSWTLPAQELDFPPCIERFKWFATAFLSGQVSQSLKEFVPYLLAPASVMTKSWSRLHPRTEVLLQTLVKANVFDKKSLMQAWKENSNFMLTAYLQWMPESLHNEIRQKWHLVS